MAEGPWNKQYPSTAIFSTAISSTAISSTEQNNETDIDIQFKVIRGSVTIAEHHSSNFDLCNSLSTTSSEMHLYLLDALVFDIRSSSQQAVTLSDTVLAPVRSCHQHTSPLTHRHDSCWGGLSAGSTKGISISSIITGTDAASESLRLLRPSLLSLAGYFNSSDVRQNALSALQVSCMITCS